MELLESYEGWRAERAVTRIAAARHRKNLEQLSASLATSCLASAREARRAQVAMANAARAMRKLNG